MDKAMRRALEADGEKLRQLTAEDHGPYFLDPPEQWFVCDACNGSGVIGRRVTVYEPGCGFPHDDTAEDTCVTCGGVGGWIVDAEPDELPLTSAEREKAQK
jgi:hypothetical protein